MISTPCQGHQGQQIKRGDIHQLALFKQSYIVTMSAAGFPSSCYHARGHSGPLLYSSSDHQHPHIFRSRAWIRILSSSSTSRSTKLLASVVAPTVLTVASTHTCRPLATSRSFSLKSLRPSSVRWGPRSPSSMLARLPPVLAVPKEKNRLPRNNKLTQELSRPFVFETRPPQRCQ